MNAGTMLNDVFTMIPVTQILWVGAIVAGLIFLVHALITAWHWREYSTGSYTSAANLLTYLSVGTGFIILMFLSALWYSLA